MTRPRWKSVRRHPPEHTQAAYAAFCKREGIDPDAPTSARAALMVRNQNAPLTQEGAVAATLSILRRSVNQYGDSELAAIEAASSEDGGPSTIRLEKMARATAMKVMERFHDLNIPIEERPTVLEAMAAAKTALDCSRVHDSRGRSARKALGKGLEPSKSLDNRIRALDGVKVV